MNMSRKPELEVVFAAILAQKKTKM